MRQLLNLPEKLLNNQPTRLSKNSEHLSNQNSQAQKADSKNFQKSTGIDRKNILKGILWNQNKTL